MPSLRLDFNNLPLIETVVRASLAAPLALTYSIVNEVAASIGDVFPNLTEPKQIDVPPGIEDIRSEQLGIGAALPGAVYSDEHSGLSVSVHAQVIVCRWNKYPGPGIVAQAYPRFSAVRDGLWRAVEAVHRTTGANFPGLRVVNMSYVNFIPKPDDSILHYLSEQFTVPVMRESPDVAKLEGSWRLTDEDADIRFSVERASGIFGESPIDGYRLTTAAGSWLSAENNDSRTKLESLHGLLLSFFSNLISDRAKREWQFQEVSG